MPNATRSADRAYSALGPGPSACKAKRPVSGRGQGRQPPKAVARSASLEAGRSQVYVKHSCSPVTGLFCHRRQRIKFCLSPVGPTKLRKLDASVGASGPHDFAVRCNISRPHAVDRSQAFRQPALPSRRAQNAAASTASAPPVRDDHDTPLWWGGMARICRDDLPDG